MANNSLLISAAVFCLILAHCALEISCQNGHHKRQMADLLPIWLFRNLPLAATSSGQKKAIHEAQQPVDKEPTEVLNWPSIDLQVGQIAGVAVDPNGDPVILHRGSAVWDGDSFDGNRRYRHANAGAIKEDVLVTLDAGSGTVLDQWGRDLFYMPHGLEVDSDGNIWVTDVALHQVFKFAPGSRVASLTLGQAFVPGADDAHFCQPTDVAVASNGVFFVADGYCNKRILKFDASGALVDTFQGPFNVPHSLTLVEDADALCVADRENSRVVCIGAGLSSGTRFGEMMATSKAKQLGRVFAVAAKGNDIYAVTGPSFPFRKANGYKLNLDRLNGEPENWSPSKGFKNPHDVAISRDGESMYAVEIGPNRITKFALE